MLSFLGNLFIHCIYEKQVLYLDMRFWSYRTALGGSVLPLLCAQRFDHLHLVCPEPESQNVKSSLTGKKTRTNQTPKTSMRLWNAEVDYIFPDEEVSVSCTICSKDSDDGWQKQWSWGHGVRRGMILGEMLFVEMRVLILVKVMYRMCGRPGTAVTPQMNPIRNKLEW